MKKKSIALIIGLMGCALLGVMAMQSYFLWQSYTLQTKLFDGQVNDALKTVTDKIGKEDAGRFLKKQVQRADSQKRADGITEIAFKDSSPNKKIRTISRKTIIRDSLKHVRQRLMNDLADERVGSFTLRSKIVAYVDENGVARKGQTFELINNPGELAGPVILHRYDTLKIDYPDPVFGNQSVMQIKENPLWKADQEHKLKLKQYRFVSRLLEQDSLEELKKAGASAMVADIAEEYEKSKEPLKDRLDPKAIDSLLRLELRTKGIDQDYSFELSTASNDSVIYSNANGTGKRPMFTAPDAYQTTIFTKNVLKDPGMLRLAFPKKNAQILSTMGGSLTTSAGLLMVLIFCFSYTIFSILRQKKISEMKTDFINNMTHEFKTPVSTIMIASEALKDDEVIADRSRISRLANIIYEENARLGSHIERVLNIAKIEKNDFKLDIKPVEVNDTISAVLDSMSLKLQKYDAKVTLHLDAEYCTINADELHFTNVLYNLVDNALKYSDGAPEITINTITVKNDLVITIADKGIGMTREEQARIFEQFYRVSTGNLHNVKGFGLGLSYVNTIVKRLDGTISVRSEKDKGSEFELRFPVV